ncbi:hypothetical protein BJX70DRAFT_374584 [Aspergillus crustosus]
MRCFEEALIWSGGVGGFGGSCAVSVLGNAPVFGGTETGLEVGGAGGLGSPARPPSIYGVSSFRSAGRCSGTLWTTKMTSPSGSSS